MIENLKVVETTASKKRGVFREMCEQIRSILDRFNDEKDAAEDVDDVKLVGFKIGETPDGSAVSSPELADETRPVDGSSPATVSFLSAGDAERQESDGGDRGESDSEPEDAMVSDREVISEDEVVAVDDAESMPGNNEEERVEERVEEGVEEVNLRENLRENLLARIGAEDLDDALGLIERLASEFNSGIMSEQSVSFIQNGLHYDRDVEAARMAGEIKGRNTRIKEESIEEFMSDGVPHPQGSFSSGLGSPVATSIFDLARTAY